MVVSASGSDRRIHVLDGQYPLFLARSGFVLGSLPATRGKLCNAQTLNARLRVLGLPRPFDLTDTNANGNIAPIRTIQGSNTGLNGANGVAIDANGNIYIANTVGNTITVYANDANGNAAPSGRLPDPRAV